VKLSDSLGLEGERIVALVGSGGKTSSLFLLGRELAAQGKKVVLATTAQMIMPDSGQIPMVLESRPGIIGERVTEILHQHNQVLVASGQEEGKLTGLPCELLLELAALPQVDRLIVEADGSRGLPLKFATDYEPVVCSEDTLVVLVLGISALGRKLSEDSFHRWELACKYLGVEKGSEITPQLAAEVLRHPRSYGRFIGVNRVVPLVNQVETTEQEDYAWEVARILMSEKGIDRVVIGAVQTNQSVRAVIHRNGEERL